MSSSVLSRLRSVALEICRHCEPDLVISGGEPMVVPKLLKGVLSYLPRDSFHTSAIITNGMWANSPKKREWFWTVLLPLLKEKAIDLHEGAVEVTLSYDRYHQYEGDALPGWKALKDEAKEGLYTWDDDEYFRPDMDGVYLGERHPARQDSFDPYPIGRGEREWSGENKPANCPTEPEENEFIVWPDGRVSACCMGGAWVGNILTQRAHEILSARRMFLDHMIETRSTGWGVLHYEDCRECRREGRKFFGTSFIEKGF